MEQSKEILMKTWSRALKTSDWAEGSPCNNSDTKHTAETIQELLRDNYVIFMWHSQSPDLNLNEHL